MKCRPAPAGQQHHEAQRRGRDHSVLHSSQQQALPHHLRARLGAAEGLCRARQVNAGAGVWLVGKEIEPPTHVQLFEKEKKMTLVLKRTLSVIRRIFLSCLYCTHGV